VRFSVNTAVFFPNTSLPGYADRKDYVITVEVNLRSEWTMSWCRYFMPKNVELRKKAATARFQSP